jgi:hypothetical protein
MRLITLLFSFLFIFSASDTFAQRLTHSIGTTLFVTTSKVTENGAIIRIGKSSFLSEQVSATYFPRYNLAEFKNASLSVGMPVGVGVGAATTSNDELRFYLSYDFPVLVDYNMGAGCTQKNNQGFGGFFGGGFGYSHIGYSLTESGSKINSYGPILHAGFRFYAGEDVITVGFTFKTGLESSKTKTYGLQVLRDL